MWIVNLALRQPYTFVVMAVLIVLMGFGAIKQTPTDIFPEIEIPVISVIWTYGGLLAPDMEKRITVYSEYGMSANVNNIKHMDSQTLNGVAVIRLFFHPNVKMELALAQVTAVSQAILRRMPPGALPPTILRFNASSVPVVQLSLSSKTLSEQEIYNFGIFKLRQQLAIINGITLPAPYGGKVRQIMVNIDPKQLQAKGVSALDVSNAVNAQNLTLPTGTAKMGEREYTVSVNSSPDLVHDFNDIPIKTVNGTVIFMRDVASVRDGFAVQQNIVRQNGSRGALITILKGSGASTLEIVNKVRDLLPTIRATAPKGLDIELLFDQSQFVRGAISGVVKESVIAAALTGAMILLFLGSWRSTLIVTISIPLSILVSLIILSILGETLNVMTLGGLALAVGLLVDDATVEIENIHRNLGMGKALKQAILDGAQQIATPAFVSTLTICVVFVSVIFLDGPARFLFVPLGMSVVFAMLASYMLSRTLIPVLVNYMLPTELAHEQHQIVVQASSLQNHGTPPAIGIFGRIHNLFNQGFEWVRGHYTATLGWALHHRLAVFGTFIVLLASGAFLLPMVGEDFFPNVDAGQFRLHVIAPAGTRIEETERIFSAVEDEIRATVPHDELALVIDNIGVPPETFNLAFGDSATVGASDGEILVSLSEDHKPTPAYMKELRERFGVKFPELKFYFQSADIVSQILNFGLAAPIDIRVQGFDRDKNLSIAREIRERVANVKGAVDVHIHQIVDAPDLHVTVDRTRAAQVGLTQQTVANDLLISLSGSTQVSPNYWLDPASGIPYLVGVQTPTHAVDSPEALLSTPITAPNQTEPQLLMNMASLERGTSVQVASHADIQPVFDVYANVQDRDLGAVSRDIKTIIADVQSKLPLGTRIILRGQVESMDSAFLRLGLGIAFAAILVYLLMVVNFQSWVDPFIIITALPGAMVGIVWMLFVTQTTFSVPSLMGAIMSIGVATANSILLVTFANDKRHEGLDAMKAALEAGSTRLRPVLMTALAMIIGMLPMSLGLGEGGEQNAPLGRAVIGGLTLATFYTLLFVPVIYSLLRKKELVARD